jgi:hypothetical protein
MPSRAPAYQIYAREALVDLALSGLTLEERGAWDWLSMYCWNEGGLPNDAELVGRILRVSTKKAAALLRALIGPGDFLFHKGENGKLLIGFQEEQREKHAEKSGKAAESARARWGDEAKKSSNGGNPSDADALRTHPERNAHARVSVAVAVAPASAVEEGLFGEGAREPAADEPSQGGADPPADGEHSYVLACVTAANRAGEANPRIPHYRVIPASHGASYQAAVDWYRESVPLEIAIEVIGAVAAGYNPTGTAKQFNSLAYFAEAVRNAFRARSEEAAAGAGVLSLVRTSGPTPPAVAGALPAVREALIGVEERAQGRFAKDEALRQAIAAWFAYWIAQTGQNPETTILDEQRERLIREALRVNRGNIGELLYAVDGALADPWHNGQKDGSRRLRVRDILGQRGTVEELASSRKKWREGIPHPFLTRLGAA